MNNRKWYVCYDENVSGLSGIKELSSKEEALRFIEDRLEEDDERNVGMYILLEGIKYNLKSEVREVKRAIRVVINEE